jgi:hypothetical protein
MTFANDSLDNNSFAANAEGATSEDTSIGVVKVAPTKAEKIAQIDQRISKLQEQRYNLENDIVAAPKAAKVIVLPAVGDTVVFTHGRRTANTEPVQRVGVVVAVKPTTEGQGGKTLPAQIRVQVGVGFDAEFCNIYPAQIVDEFTAE